VHTRTAPAHTHREKPAGIKCSIAGLGLLALAVPPAAPAAPIPEYRALYRVAVDDVDSGFADYSLSYDAVAGEYTLIERTGKESQYVATLQFVLVNDSVEPREYRKEVRGCATCTTAVRFNWATGRVEYKNRGSRLVVRLVEHDGWSDFLETLLGLTTMLPGRRELAGFDDALSVTFLGTDEVPTQLGPVRAERSELRAAKKRDVVDELWRAPDLADVPLRRRTDSGKSTTTLELADLQGIDLPR
jgi:hypothetical protein